MGLSPLPVCPEDSDVVMSAGGVNATCLYDSNPAVFWAGTMSRDRNRDDPNIYSPEVTTITGSDPRNDTRGQVVLTNTEVEDKSNEYGGQTILETYSIGNEAADRESSSQLRFQHDISLNGSIKASILLADSLLYIVSDSHMCASRGNMTSIWSLANTIPRPS
ncbi:hypothetical protein R1flu_011102 [Riccia fluitans]|uniref:Uncharacterized protein n=1 Tax=Riccia fluitans TaxID=41844 RepID=A0ABD1Z6V6_9MARC